MTDTNKMIETVGAKIRNRLSPYNLLITIIESDDIPDEEALKYLKEKIKTHKQCLDELVDLSLECEHEPSDKWDKYGGGYVKDKQES